MFRLVEFAPRRDAFRGRLADVADLGHLFDRRRQQRVQTAEMIRQYLARLLPDVPNAKRKQQPRQVARFARLDAAQQVVRPGVHLFAKRQKLFHRQVVQISSRFHQPCVDQLLQVAFAATVNVHRVARGKVHQIAQKLRRTRRARAADSGFFLIVVNRRAAHRTELRHFIRLRVRRTLVQRHPDDLRDDLARLAHRNRIPHPHIQLPDKVAVVQRRARHGRAREPHRLQHRIGC